MEPIASARRPWAVLAADRTHRHWKVIDAILDALREAEVPALDWGPPLLFAYAGRVAGRRDYLETAASYLDRAVSALEALSLGPYLYGGVAGGGWLAAHLASLLGADTHEAFDLVDEALLEIVSRDVVRVDYDLIRGTCGIGVYFLERLPAESARQGLAAVVQSLRRSAIRVDDDQVTWDTPPQILPDWQRELAPGGYRNLGVAHGVPGIIAVLSAMAAEGALDNEGARLLADASRWVVTQVTPDYRLPSWVGAGTAMESSRLAWCYGELGAVVALSASARATRLSGVSTIAARMMETAAGRAPTALTRDACLCHGAAGNAHLFNRLYQATGLPACREAALRWYDLTLEMRQASGGLAGYLMWRPDPDDVDSVVPTTDGGFLNGVSGVGLALLAAVAPQAPRWDRVLLAAID
jgi:lantibiotic modifying enzyme